MAQIKDLNDLASHMSAYNAQDIRSQAKQSHSLEELNVRFTQYIDWMKDQAGEAERRRIEAEREAKQVSNAPRRPTSGSGSPATSGLNLPNIPGIKGVLAFTAGLAALGTALAGLRGWEKLAITNADKIGKALRSIIPLTFADKLVGKIVPSGYTTFSAFFGDRMAMLRNSALKLFGFADDMKGGGMPGGNTGPRMPGGNELKTPLTTQISNRMSSFMSMLKGQYYSMVGLGVDGETVQTRGADGRLGSKKTVSIFHKIIQGFNRIMAPIKAAGVAVTNALSGSAGKLLASFGNAGKGLLNSGAGRFFTGVFNKILWPLGVLMSAWEGVKKFQDEMANGEGVMKAYNEGITTTLSNFAGAPFDLIKNGILWILRKLLPWGVGDDGQWDEGSMIGKIGKWAEKFSFEKLFKSVLMAPFNLITGAVTFIKDLFRDPAGTWEKFATSVWGEGTFIDNYILNPLTNLLTSIGKIFGFGTNDDPMSPDTAGGTVTRVKFLWNDMIEGFTVRLPNKIIAIAEHFKEKVMSIVPEGMFEKIKCIFTHDIPMKVKQVVKDFKEGITLAGGALWKDLKEVFTVAIPAKITAMVTSFTDLFAKTEGADGDPQPNGGVWSGIKNIFTSLIPNMISDIVTEGKQMMSGIVESVVEKLQGLIDMIFDFIPSVADIKSNVISSISGMPAGDTILETLGLKPKIAVGFDMDAAYRKEAFGIPAAVSFEAQVAKTVALAVETGLVATLGTNAEDRTLKGAAIALFNASTGTAVTKKLMPSDQRRAEELKAAFTAMEASKFHNTQGVVIGNIDNSTTSTSSAVVGGHAPAGSSFAKMDPRFEGWGPPNRQHLSVF